MRQAPDDLLSPSDAAKLLGLTPAGVVAISARGQLQALRTVGGRRLFLRQDVELLLAARRDAVEAQKVTPP